MNLLPTILIVDDKLEQAIPLQEFLQLRGCSAIVESNPYNVVTLIQKRSFDIACVDIILGNYEYSGLDVIIDIKTFSENTKIIAMTGLGSRNQAASAIQFGASIFQDLSELESVDLFWDIANQLMKEPVPIDLDDPRLRENLMRYLWDRLWNVSSNRQGMTLLGISILIIRSIKGFGNIHIISSPLECDNFHLLFSNLKEDSFWKSRGEIITMYCNHWSNIQTEEDEINKFICAISNRPKKPKTAIFITMGEINRRLIEKCRKDAKGLDIVIANSKDIEKLIFENEHREEKLREIIIRNLY